MKRIGLIGPSDREELARLAMRLEERGAEGVLFDSHQDPEIMVSWDTESLAKTALRDFSGFYVADLGIRSALRYAVRGGVDEKASLEAAAASRRHMAAWYALLYRLSARCRVVNPPETFDLHALKPWEVVGYSRADLPVPWTMATSDPRSLIDLPSGSGRSWIQKGMVGGYGYTEAFEPGAVLAEGPRLVQERIEGDNVRAYVLDGKVIGSAEIASIEGDETDSRRGEVRVRRMELPTSAAQVAVAATIRWGLHFAAVDFMLEAKTQRYVLLECNSAPFFLSFEQQTGWDISSRLADYLLGRKR